MKNHFSQIQDYTLSQEEQDESDNLPEELKEAVLALVEYGKTTPQQIIQIPQSTIERISKINSKQSTHLLFSVSKLIFRQNPISVSKLVKIKKLSLGCPVLDGVLDGGLLMQGITEISGESATGKTQFVLQAMLQTILPEEFGGLGGSCLYLCTEDIPVTRWNQLVTAYVEKYPTENEDYYHSRMFHCKVYTIQKLTEIIQTKVLPLIRTKNIKLVVIDSIAALFRVEMATLDQSQEKALILHSHAQILKQLSDENKLPILIVNQVTDSFSSNDSNNSASFCNSKVVPSLGLHWANSINMRIMLSKTKHIYFEPNGDPVEGSAKRKLNEGIGIRSMSIIFAPHLPNSSCYYLIVATGLHGLVVR